jgi:formylglycine-generating enzyme required for sulfatase activity
MKEEQNYLFRGGSWYNAATHAAMAAAYPGREVVNLGFRLAFDKEAIRVIRGGSWGSAAGGARAANRGGDLPGDRGNDLGFRLIRETS